MSTIQVSAVVFAFGLLIGAFFNFRFMLFALILLLITAVIALVGNGAGAWANILTMAIVLSVFQGGYFVGLIVDSLVRKAGPIA